MANLRNLFSLDRESLAAYFMELGEKSFRANQVFKWIYQSFEPDFNNMSNLGKSLKQKLQEQACLDLPVLEQQQKSKDGTQKWLLRLHDGNAVEVVLIPEQDRATLCISSQVGCTLNCSFCATARQGFNRNLSAAEIVGQVWLAWKTLQPDHTPASNNQGSNKAPRPITNIVFMGMGEPLLNFEEVTNAIRILLDDFGFGFSKRRITLSTAGVIPGMAKLASILPVSLAVSLHATTDDLRNDLVPLNKKYPIATLLKACKEYTEIGSRSRVTFEYLMLDGVNDSNQQANELADLLSNIPAKINLIPYNPVKNAPYRRSNTKRINAFRDILMNRGIVTMTRKTRGDDIDAACGQLVGNVDDRTHRSERMNTNLPK